MKNRILTIFLISIIFVSCSNQDNFYDEEAEPFRQELMSASFWEAGTYTYISYVEFSDFSPNKKEYCNLAAKMYAKSSPTDVENTEENIALMGGVDICFFLQFYFDANDGDSFTVSFYCKKEESTFFIADGRKEYFLKYLDLNNEIYNKCIKLHKKSREYV